MPSACTTHPGERHLRLLHTADWQIGKQYGQFERDDAALLTEARFRTIERLCALAVEHRVDMVVVAGDVFDAQTVADKTIHRLFQSLAGYPGPWVLLPGNHDAALSESVWTRAMRLGAVPRNVYVCLKPEPLFLDDIKVAVLPAPLTQRHTYTDLTEWFSSVETPPGMYRIGLAHGSVQGILADDIDSTNPIAWARAQHANLEYLALGDWHGAKRVDERTWYSGTPETDRFKANESGQALLVELSGPGASPAVTPLSSGMYRWQSLEAPLAVSSDVDRALAMLSTLGPADVAQVKFIGQTDLEGHRRIQRALGEAQGRARSLLADLSAVRLEPTDDDINALQADGYVGEAIADLRAGQTGPNAELCRDALVLLASILDRRRSEGNGETLS